MGETLKLGPAAAAGETGGLDASDGEEKGCDGGELHGGDLDEIELMIKYEVENAGPARSVLGYEMHEKEKRVCR
ncbi:uncharacterized protein PgNI_12147 [Pyricularia grisea]|uniref:Uncharacterized protein n=1 Tax=Pyricularia grisea TaxID=148305 RepID=A0A6P8AQR0_PYRGI|nr:uncharacterized protein PgNI_12147 [Pyricularia grisea]TLD04410.1 hypothetical protein PgNI_12147 [Pyricularia grisea]